MGRPRILWISDEVPDADLGGGSIRQYHLLRRVTEHAEVDLLLIGALQDEALRLSLRRVVSVPRPRAPLSGLGDGPLGRARRRVHNLSSVLPNRPPSEVVMSRRVVAALRSQLSGAEGYDAVQVEHETLAGLLPPRRRVPWAITLHNLLSVRSRQRAKLCQRGRVKWLWEQDARCAQRWERRIVSRYDLTITVSSEDASALGGRPAVVPNGVDLERFRPSPLPDAPRLIFSASFNYEPNVDAAQWACRELLPLVQSRVPEATLLLVGREPDERVRSLACLPGVEAHFDVPSVVPFLASSRVALVPLRQGSGTRLKALEAMAAARPLAGTTVGLEGLPLEDGCSAMICDDPEGLAQRVLRLLEDSTTARSTASAGRRIAETRYGWDQVASSYLDLLLSLVRESRPARSGG